MVEQEEIDARYQNNGGFIVPDKFHRPLIQEYYACNVTACVPPPRTLRKRTLFGKVRLLWLDYSERVRLAMRALKGEDLVERY